MDANAVSVTDNGTFNSLIDLSFPNGQDIELSGGTLSLLNSSTIQMAYFDTTNIKSGTFNLTGGTTLGVASNTIDIASGTVLVKDGAFGPSDKAGSLTIRPGGVLTHSQRFLSGLALDVTGALDIQAGGKVDVSGKGLNGGSSNTSGEYYDGSGNITTSAGGGAGGGYGGQGGYGRYYGTYYQPAPPYGRLEDPQQLGAGGGGPGGGKGGGLVYIQASQLVLEGEVLANGQDSGNNAAGSGGGIKIEVGSLSGSGFIRSNGGRGYYVGNLSQATNGNGSGGRVAVDYDTLALPEDNIRAFSGNFAGANGAAGTIYLKDNALPNGKVIIGNNNLSSSSITPLLTQLTDFQSLKLKGKSQLTLLDTLNVKFSNSGNFEIIIESGADLTIEDNPLFDINSIKIDNGILNSKGNQTLGTFELSNSGTLNILDTTIFNVPTFNASTIESGTVNIQEESILDVVSNDITVNTGTTIIKEGKFGTDDSINNLAVSSGGTITNAATSPEPLVIIVAGDANIAGVVKDADGAIGGIELSANNLTISSGSNISQSDRSLAGLKLKATNNLTIESGVLIDLNAKGLRGGKNGSQFGNFGETYSQDLTTIITGAQGSSTGAGGSYGGIGETSVGNAQPSPIYGDKNFPNLLGSGGGAGFGNEKAGHGGGKLFIEAQNLTIDGTIKVNGGNGQNHVGGGSGGSVLIFAEVIDGNGTIEAKGGNGGCVGCNGGAGGGGRIAIYTTTPVFPAANISVAPGAADSGFPKAGSIVYKTCSYDTNVGIDSVAIPLTGSLPFDTTIVPEVVVKNYSPKVQTFPVNVSLGTGYSDESYVNLQPGESATLTFAPYDANQSGTFNFSATTTLPGDNCDPNSISFPVAIDNGLAPLVTYRSPGSGGTTGTVTMDIRGKHFQSGVQVWLDKGGGNTISPTYTELVTPSKIFASFNLVGADTGFYDLVVRNPDMQQSVYDDGLRVVPGSFGWEGAVQADCLASDFDPGQLLDIRLNHQPSARRGRPFRVEIWFKNLGNIDIPVITKRLRTEEDDGLTLDRCELPYFIRSRKPDSECTTSNPAPCYSSHHWCGYRYGIGGGNHQEFGYPTLEKEILLDFKEENGPSNILRAGASGRITVWMLPKSYLAGDNIKFILED